MSTDLTISYSQLGVWNRCRFSWHLGYDQGWTPKEGKPYFEKGSLIHEGMAEYYRLLQANPQNLGSTAFLQGAMMRWLAEGKSNQLVNNVGWLLKRYIEDFSSVEDRGLEIVEIEKEFTVDLETPKGRDFTLHGILDLLVRDQGKLWVWDHKSAGNSKFYSEMAVMMDAQMPTYINILRKYGLDIFGLKFNFLNAYDYKKRDEVTPDKLFKRMPSYRTDSELATLEHEFGLAVDDIIDNRDNPRRSLSKDCERCQFAEPCMLNMKGMDLNTIMPAYFRQKGSEDITNDLTTGSDVDYAEIF